MNIKHICLFPVVALLLTACSSDLAFDEKKAPQAQPGGEAEQSETDLVPVTFTVSDKVDFTRAATSIVTFNDGEAVKVFVRPDGEADYTGYNYVTDTENPSSSCSLVTTGTPPYFPPGAGTTVEAFAYYPATASEDGEAATFTVQDNQVSNASYKASDLMYAANRTITKGSGSSTVTNLEMAHLMAQLHLNVTATYGVTINRILVNARRSVTFTPAAGTAVLTDAAASDIVAATAAGDAYVCIPAQAFSGVTIKVETGAEGDAATTATFTFDAEASFLAGKSYPINLTVNTLMPGTISVISGWDGTSPTTISPTTNYAPTGDMTIDPINPVTYNGSGQEPALVVRKGGNTLAKDAADGYTCQWYNNTNAGTGIVIVQSQGTNAGSVAVGTFTINPKPLTDGMVSAIGAQTYTRSQITPAVTVTDGSELTLNTHYTVSYGENTNVATGGSVTVTGAGNYTGNVVKNFDISPKDISGMTLTLTQTSATYTGSAITASVSSLKDGTFTLISGTDYTVANGSVTSATNAAANASASVTNNTITVNGTGNYTGSKSGTWHINRATPTLTISSYSPNPMSLTSTSATGTINVSRSGDGAVTATSSATGVATVSVTGTTVTVTAIADGSATITVKMNQGTNHTAYTATDKTVSVSASGFIIAPALGDKYYSDGTWGNNPHANGATVIGIVAWLGSDSDLKCGKSHGLVMAKSDVSGTKEWGGYGTDESSLTNTSTIDGCRSNNKNGLTNTTNLGSSHAAAYSATTYSPAAPSTSGNTTWFLPSAAQWLAVLGPDGIGKQTTSEQVWASWYDADQTAYNNIKNALTASGVGGTALQYSYYWSSTEYSSSRAVYVFFNSSSGVYVDGNGKSNAYYVRAFLAF